MDDQYAHWSQFRLNLILWGGLNGYLFIPFLAVVIKFSLFKLMLFIGLIVATLVIEKVFKYKYSYIPSALRRLVFGGNEYTRRGRRRYSL